MQRADLEGGPHLAMRIWLNPDRLAALGITPECGFAPPQQLPATVGRTKGESTQMDLMADTDLRTPEEFEKLIVREQGGSIVRLGDLARVELGSEEAGETKKNDRDAVFVSIWPLPGVNEIDVANRLTEAMARLKPTLPAGVDMSMAFDATMYMRNSLKEISKTLSETILIVGVVIFLFLGSVRTALIPLIAMPVSLIGAAIFMTAFGFSLNLLTLLAIVLSVGLVVDDAIVVVENIERHVREGKSRIEAALASAQQLVAPIVAMTITLAAVYAPIGFQSGLTGVLFKEFAFTLAVAVIVSGLVALTLSPVMSARLVRDTGERTPLSAWVTERFERTRNWYAGVLDATLAQRNLALLVGAAIVVLLAPLFLLSPRELAPTEDQGEISFYVESAPDASVRYTADRTSEVVLKLLELPEAYISWEISLPSSALRRPDAEGLCRAGPQCAGDPARGLRHRGPGVGSAHLRLADGGVAGRGAVRRGAGRHLHGRRGGDGTGGPGHGEGRQVIQRVHVCRHGPQDRRLPGQRGDRPGPGR